MEAEELVDWTANVGGFDEKEQEMANAWFSLYRPSSMQTFVLSAAIALGVFFGGHAVLQAAGRTPCDDQCEFINCEPPQQGGCGACGQYVEWTEFYNAGKNCISCGVGWCNPLTKVTIDKCEVCEASFIQQCLSCNT